MRTQADHGSRSDVIRSTNFVADHVTPALNGFYRALALRWQQLVAETIAAGRWDYPTRIVRAGAPYLSPVEPPNEWTFSSKPARLHIDIDTGSCLTLRQVRQQGHDPENLTACPGAVLPEPGVDPGDVEGTVGDVPQYIDCRVKSLLQEVVNWAWAERTHLLEQLQLFDHHDLDALRIAYDDLLELGDQLTLNRHESQGDGGLGLSDLGETVKEIRARRGETPGWWSRWTGLLATTVKDGFFSSVAPTLNNQSVIAGYLADLYSNRATIVNAGRNNVLRAVQQATEALDRTQVVVTHITPYWRAAQGVGGLVAISGAWSGAGAAVGATMVAVGYIGEELDVGGATQAEFTGDMISVVQRLNERARSISTEIEGYERGYDAAVAALIDGVNTVHSFNLELYDHTLNNPDGMPDDRGGFAAEVDTVLRVAEVCYQAGELTPHCCRSSGMSRRRTGTWPVLTVRRRGATGRSWRCVTCSRAFSRRPRGGTWWQAT